MKAVSFIFPQEPQSEDFLDYSASIDEIEEATGLNFFPDLSVRKQINLEEPRRDFELEVLLTD